MEKSEWIQRLKEFEKNLHEEGKGSVCKFARCLQHYNGGNYGLLGILEMVEELSILYRIDELIGENLSWYIQFREYDIKDPEETCWKEKAEFQIKYGQLIEKYETDDWTPEIKKRFEDGLDFLKVALKQESVTSAQEVTK